MADITKCSGEKCEVYLKCWRYKAPPSLGGQSYFITPPGKDKDCEYYWPMDPVLGGPM